MALLDKIKDEYVKEKYGFDYSHPFYTEIDFDEIATRYAKAVLKRAAENVKISVKERVDGTKFIAVIKESILNTKLD